MSSGRSATPSGKVMPRSGRACSSPSPTSFARPEALDAESSSRERVGAGKGFPRRGLIQEHAAFRGSLASAGKPGRIPHDGVRSQHAQTGFVGGELFVQALLVRLVAGDSGAGLVEFRLRGVHVAAGVVEIGLRLPQCSCTAPGGDLRVPPIASPERSDCLAHGLDLLQVPPDVIELAHGFGDILERRAIERTQRVGQRFREAPLVRILGQLRLAQLNQGVDQRIIPLGPQSKQPLIHGASIGLGVGEHLAMGADGFDQAVSRQRGLLRRGQPKTRADALFGDEEPRFGTGSAGNRAQAAAQGQCQHPPGAVAPPELHPGVADAALVALAHQQVPLHALAAVPVRLDAGRAQVGIQ